MRRCSGSDEPNDGNKVDLKGHKLRRRLGRGAGLVEEMRQKSLKRAFEACKAPNSDNPGVPQGENESSLDIDLEDMEQDNFEDLEDEVEERSQLGELHSKQKKEEEDMDKDLEGFITSDEEDAAAQLDPEVREFREQMHGRQRGHAWRQKDSFTHYIRGLLIGIIGLRIPEKDRTRKEAEHEAASKFFEDTLGQYLSIAFSSHWVTQSLSSGLRELLDTLPVIELGGKPDLSCSEEDEVWAKDKAESPSHCRDNGHHGRARINSAHRRSNRQRNALRSPQHKASTKRRRANQGLGSPYYIPRKEEWSASGSDTPHPSDQEFIVSDDHFEDEGEGSDLRTDADEDCVVVGDLTKIKRMGKKRREMAAAAAEDALKSSGGLRSRNKMMKLVQGGHQLRGKSGGGACPQRGTSRSSRPRTTRARECVVSTSNDKKNSLPKKRVITKRRVPSSGSELSGSEVRVHKVAESVDDSDSFVARDSDHATADEDTNPSSSGQADLDLHPAPHKRRVSSTRKHQCSGKRRVRGKLPHCRQVHAAAKEYSPDPQAAAEGSLSTPHGPYNLRSSLAAAPASQPTHGRPPRSSQAAVANGKGAVPSESRQCLSADKAIALANESAAAAAVAAAASIKAAAAAKSAASYANACLTSCTLSAAEVHATQTAVAAALSEAQAAELAAAAAAAAVCVNEERPLECPLTYPQAQPPRVSPLQPPRVSPLQSSPQASKVLESLEDSLDSDDNVPDPGRKVKILHQRALSPDSANELIEGQRGAGNSRTRVQGRRVLCSDSENDVHDKEAEGMVSPKNVSTRSLSIEIPQILPALRTRCDKHQRSGSKHRMVSVDVVKTVHSVGTSSDEMTPPRPPQYHDQPMHPHLEEEGREHVLDYTSEGGRNHLVYYEGKWKGKCGLCNRGRVGVFGHCLWRLMISGHPQDPRTGLQLAPYHSPSRSAPASLQNHHHHTQRCPPLVPSGSGVGRDHHKVAGAIPISGHHDLEESLTNEVRPPPVHEFYVGRSCGDRVILHHSISHFRARLMAALRRELKRRMDQGCMSTGPSDYAQSMRRTRTRGKRAMKEILEDEQLLSSWLDIYRRVEDAGKHFNWTEVRVKDRPPTGHQAQLALAELHSDVEGYESDIKWESGEDALSASDNELSCSDYDTDNEGGGGGVDNKDDDDDDDDDGGGGGGGGGGEADAGGCEHRGNDATGGNNRYVLRSEATCNRNQEGAGPGADAGPGPHSEAAAAAAKRTGLPPWDMRNAKLISDIERRSRASERLAKGCKHEHKTSVLPLVDLSLEDCVGSVAHWDKEEVEGCTIRREKRGGRTCASKRGDNKSNKQVVYTSGSEESDDEAHEVAMKFGEASNMLTLEDGCTTRNNSPHASECEVETASSPHHDTLKEAEFKTASGSKSVGLSPRMQHNGILISSPPPLNHDQRPGQGELLIPPEIATNSSHQEHRMTEHQLPVAVISSPQQIGGCYLCNATGHWAKDCPDRDKCFKCGKHGHWAKDCPHY